MNNQNTTEKLHNIEMEKAKKDCFYITNQRKLIKKKKQYFNNEMWHGFEIDYKSE